MLVAGGRVRSTGRRVRAESIGDQTAMRWPERLAPDCSVVVDELTPEVATMLDERHVREPSSTWLQAIDGPNRHGGCST